MEKKNTRSITTSYRRRKEPRENVTDVFYPSALKMLGDMYKQGQGVEKDEEKAEEYYQWAQELRAR